MTCVKCDKPCFAKSMCQAHYRQDLRLRHKLGEPIRKYANDEKVAVAVTHDQYAWLQTIDLNEVIREFNK